MWYRFEKGNPKGICRVKHFQIAWYDMEQNGDCFDEDFIMSDGIERVIPYVETIEDENNSDRSRVFVHMDNGDVYELKMEKLSKEQLNHCNNFYSNWILDLRIKIWEKQKENKDHNLIGGGTWTMIIVGSAKIEKTVININY